MSFGSDCYENLTDEQKKGLEMFFVENIEAVSDKCLDDLVSQTMNRRANSKESLEVVDIVEEVACAIQAGISESFREELYRKILNANYH